MSVGFNGKWSYRSFSNAPIEIVDGKANCESTMTEPWAPPGDLEVTTDKNGNVTGTLKFALGIKLNISGRVFAAEAGQPASAELIGEGLGAVYIIHAWFIPGSDHMVGTVVCTAGDLGHKPVGTIGPCVAYPVK